MAETIKAEVLLLHASADGAIAQRWFAHQCVAELSLPPKELAGGAGNRAAYCDVALHSSTNGAQGQPAMASVQDWSSSTVATGVAPPEGVRRDEREGLLQPKIAEQLLQPKSAEQSEQNKQIQRRPLIDELKFNNMYDKSLAEKKRIWAGEGTVKFKKSDIQEWFKVWDETRLFGARKDIVDHSKKNLLR